MFDKRFADLEVEITVRNKKTGESSSKTYTFFEEDPNKVDETTPSLATARVSGQGYRGPNGEFKRAKNDKFQLSDVTVLGNGWFNVANPHMDWDAWRETQSSARADKK
jgi:hypothetical protein